MRRSFTCKKCIYKVPDELGDYKCKRFPPQYNPETGGSESPSVTEFDYCFEFKEKGKKGKGD